MLKVNDIRLQFQYQLEQEQFVVDKSGVKLLEIPFAQFTTDEDAIFGTVNHDWNRRELEWYDSQSLHVYDIPPPVPSVWKDVASTEGYINSNYGYLVYSKANGSQYQNVLKELQKQPTSRRAIMIYTRPSMHQEYGVDGMSDFICTNTVQYLIRDGCLMAHVSMRSNDAIYGYKGDVSWQKTVQQRLADELGLPAGPLVWNVGSLHVYERHFNLVKG